MELNIELLKKLKTRFARMRHKQHFNMEPVAMKTDCGTAMCVAGHTLHLAGYKMRLVDGYSESNVAWSGRIDFDFISPSGRKVKDPLERAARLLGMRAGWNNVNSSHKDGAYTLFHDYSLKTPKQAAKRIQGIIETGKV